jgi:hypothetical protein
MRRREKLTPVDPSQGCADRLLVYLTLFTAQAINRMTRVCRRPWCSHFVCASSSNRTDILTTHTHTHIFVQCPTKDAVQKEMYQLSIETFKVAPCAVLLGSRPRVHTLHIV